MNPAKRTKEIEKTLDRLLKLRGCHHCKFNFMYDPMLGLPKGASGCNYSPCSAAEHMPADLKCDEDTHSAFEPLEEE